MLTKLTPREMPNLINEDSIKMYGMNKEDLYSLFEQICGPTTPANVTMFAMGIISDAQAVMINNPERARQFMNVSKWLLSHVHVELHNQDMERYK